MILHILVLVTSCLLTINAANEQPVTTQRLLPKDSKFDISDWELCKAVGLQSREDANVIISPVSLKVVLAVLLDASKGNTAKEIADFLQFTNGTDENEKVKIRNTYSMLLHSLQKQTPSLTSAVATRIFAHNTVTLNTTFLKVLKDYYSTEVDKVNLNEVASVVKKINKWADITTSGHVKDLLQESDVKKDAVMILMNVIFFNGLWEQPFEENQTKVEPFYLNNTHSTTVKMMKGVQQLLYAQVFDYKMQLLRLPYLDTSFAMYIVLPSVKDGLDDLIENVTPGRVQALMSTLQLSKVNVTIPRFDFSYNIHLKGILENLGVRTMFENADFSNLATGPSSGLRVSNILQKAGIEVNEKGSAAYAATVVEIDNRVKEDEPIFEFNANRPFLFFIEDDKTRNVMFVGKVGNPKAETPPAFQTNPIQPPKPVIQEEGLLYSSAPQQEPLSHRPENTNELARERLLYFDIGLLDEIRSQTKRNFVISPLSIKLMLSLILETAKGNSANEIRRSLSLSDDLNIAQKQLLLPPRVFKTANTSLLLKSGNAVYISHYLTPKKEYQQAIEKKYSASVQQVDFSNSQVAARTINNWVSRVTAGLIPTIVSAGALPPNTQMVLVNAVYFKGIWKNTFPESRTQVKPFNVSPTETVYTNMMYNKNLYRYKVAPEVSAELVHIPFQDENFRLVVMLPTGQNTIENLLRDLRHSRLINTLTSEELQEVVLELPRFKIEYETELTNILKQLRITEIFTDNAQLENMVEGTNQKLRISKVIQKATIEVNEQGAEAAAATGAVVEPLMKPVHEPISFIVNRPFVYFIYNSQYKVILFEGCIMKPELASKGPNAPPQSYKPPRTPVTTETSPNYQPPIDERIQNPQEYQPPINNNVVYNNNNNNQQIPSELFPSHQQNPQTVQGNYQQPSNLVPITRPNINQIRPTLPVNQASAPPPPPIANLSPRTQYTRNYRTESTLVFPSSK